MGRRSRPDRSSPIVGRSGRRRVIALVCALCVLAAACGDGDDEATTTRVGQGEAPRAPAQELVIGTDEDPWVDAAETDKKRFPGYPLQADVCETLVELTPDFDVGASLASEWEHVGDSTYRFTLKGEPTFSTGMPVTAEAVKYTLDYTAQEPAVGGDDIGPDSTTVIDERTVEVRTTQPNLRLIQQITHPTYQVLSPGSDPLNNPDEVVCSGPFEVVEYVPAERLVVQRNDDYWGEPAELEKITFRFYPDDTTRTLALQNGEVDLITDVPRGIVASVEQMPGIKVARAPVGQVILAYVARREASGAPRILDDPDLRRAVAHAMDKEEYVQGVLDGNAEVVDTVSPPAVLGEFADRVEGIPYDPDEAARILDQAGWTLGPDGVRTKDGQPLELTIVFDPGRIDQTTVEFVAAQLREVGIVGSVDRLDPGAYRDRLKTGEYDLDLSSPNQNDANPAFLLALRWWSKASGDNAKIISLGPGTRYDGLIDRIQQEVTDEEELRRLSAEAMRELIDVEVGALPLAGTYRIYAMKQQVQGLQPHPSGTNQRWRDVYLTE